MSSGPAAWATGAATSRPGPQENRQNRAFPKRATISSAPFLELRRASQAINTATDGARKQLADELRGQSAHSANSDKFVLARAELVDGAQPR
jgi:hypothetical protein